MAAQTSLYQLHLDNGGKIVDFAGYAMPVQYKDGIIAEHNWTRNNCGIFDVSHMGQLLFTGKSIAGFFESITPSEFTSLTDAKAKYTVLTNNKGGIIDDLIIYKITDERFFVVVNAARKEIDIAHMKKYLPSDITMEYLSDRSLIAVQGPQAVNVLSKLTVTPTEIANMEYMSIFQTKLTSGEEVYVTRTGYTGEDGFEVSVANSSAGKLWSDLLVFDLVKPIGLGARDSLRLEMGYPLYGHDLNEETTPVESALKWVVASGKPASYPGSDVIKKQIEDASLIKKKRIGIKLLEAGVLREGYELYADAEGTKLLGALTSGGFSPTLNASIGQTYLPIENAKSGTEIFVKIRNRLAKAEVTSFTFVKAKTATSSAKKY